MALADNLLVEKQKLTSLLDTEYPAQNFRDSPLVRLLIVKFLLGELVSTGGTGGDASAANQISVQSTIGAIPSKVLGVQGVVGGVSVPVTANAGTNLNTSALSLESGGNLDSIKTNTDTVRLKATLSTSAPTTSVASAITSTTLLALNTNRKWVTLRNDSTSVAYIAKSGTASTSSVALLQPQGTLYFDDYSGTVTAIWVAANGFMRIEEGV